MNLEYYRKVSFELSPNEASPIKSTPIFESQPFKKREVKSATKLNGGSISSSEEGSQSKIFKRAQALAKKFNGECLSTNFSICKGKNAIKFRCLNTHTFFVPADSIPATADEAACCEQWCYKCKKFYETCTEVAKANGLQVVEGLFTPKIILRCEHSAHSFKISYSKKLNSLSCADCRREEREEWKEQLRQEELLRT